MGRILGIYVSSEKYLGQIIEVCRAAKKKDVAVRIFFTHNGTRLCTDPRLKELEGLATIALCKVGFEANALEPADAKVEKKAFLSQSWHAEMIYDCDRYLVF
jgi:hypothetical protein